MNLLDPGAWILAGKFIMGASQATQERAAYLHTSASVHASKRASSHADTHNKTSFLLSFFPDNVIYPGTPDLLVHLRNKDQYSARLLPAPYEYEQRWKKDWEPQQDAMCAAIRLEGLDARQREAAEARLREGVCSSFECRDL